jgi:hypothetical protein
MGAAGQDLFDQIADGLWSVLEKYRSQGVAKLAVLKAEPGVLQGSPLDGLLESLRADDIASGDAGVQALIRGIQSVLPEAGPADAVTLHGFDPGQGHPRGLALLVKTPAPTASFMAAMTDDGARGIAIRLAATGLTAAPVTVSLAQGWALAISGAVNAAGSLVFPQGGPAAALNGGLNVQLSLQYSGEPIELGSSTGPHVTLGSFSVGAETAIGINGIPKVQWTVSLSQAELSLVADAVAALLGNSLKMPIDLKLAADPETGLAVQGGGIRANLPTNISLPGVEIGALELEVSLPGGAGRLDFGFGINFTASLPGFPLFSVAATGLGAKFPLSIGTGSLGLGGVEIVPPNGLGMDLNLPIVSGGGFLQNTGSGAYGAFLDLNLLAVDIKAFGLLQLPVPGKGLSFIAIISAEFPFPGIDLSFGFALAGVGGIVGINRRLDTAALETAIFDGSATQLLFPVDASKHASAIIATMGKVFPVAKNHVLVGPILKVTWGGRIVSMVAAVVADLPDPLQFTIIGIVEMAMPDPLAPAIFMHATFSGAFEISPTPGYSLSARLEGSNLTGMPLSGDVFFLLRGGSDPLFVFSAGGFHPRYVAPKGVPDGVQRLHLSMTPPGVPGLRAEAYLAITTNTVQFGARLELCDEIDGCGVDGWFGFDTLFKWDPAFSFSIRASAGVAVQVLGETLMGINIDLLLEGPSRWHVQGTGSVRLFLFHASLDFEHKWGPMPTDGGTGITPEAALIRALAEPSNWSGNPPPADASVVSLSASARNLISAGKTIHPLGSVTLRQGAVPFDIAISRFQQKLINPPQTWSMGLKKEDLVKDWFPPGELLNLSEDEKFQRPAFESWNSGGRLRASDAVNPELRTWNTDYTPITVPDGSLFARSTGFFGAAEYFLGDRVESPNFWDPPNLEVVTVLPAQPVTVATTDTFAPVDVPSAGYTETVQAAIRQFGTLGKGAQQQIVESWEVGQ